MGTVVLVALILYEMGLRECELFLYRSEILYSDSRFM
jgi:hypothetical protein